MAADMCTTQERATSVQLSESGSTQGHRDTTEEIDWPDGMEPIQCVREYEYENDGERLQRPGFGWKLGLPELRIKARNSSIRGRCFRGVGEIFAFPITICESQMLNLMNAITDEPDWHRKVFDESIVAKWAEEVSQEAPATSQASGPEEWARRRLLRTEITPEEFDFCMRELRDKALFFDENLFVTVLDGQYSVVKSDCTMPTDLMEQLRLAVKPLLDVPESEKDWRPGSDGQVLDLVDPSLHPLVYGRSLILPDENISIANCNASVGKGEILGKGKIRFEGWKGMGDHSPKLWSTNYQWLPSEVRFNEYCRAKICTYINNLDPERHTGLYNVIEKCMDEAISMWNVCLPLDTYRMGLGGETPTERHRQQYAGPIFIPKKPKRRGNEAQYEDKIKHWRQTRKMRICTVQKDYDDWRKPWKSRIEVDELFVDQGFQIIVKLTSVELTPEKPRYEAGGWHVEGLNNEKIAATAIFYYDCENVTDSTLSFRYQTFADLEDLYDSSDDDEEDGAPEEAFGTKFDMKSPCIQELGSVAIKEGRVLAFPNTLQHRDGSFELKDKTKPGHRRVLVLWLVDPWCRIISTGNVPPQQRTEITEDMIADRMLPLPLELVQCIADELNKGTFSRKRAKRYRLKLMRERTAAMEAARVMTETRAYDLRED